MLRFIRERHCGCVEHRFGEEFNRPFAQLSLVLYCDPASVRGHTPPSSSATRHRLGGSVCPLLASTRSTSSARCRQLSAISSRRQQTVHRSSRRSFVGSCSMHVCRLWYELPPIKASRISFICTIVLGCLVYLQNCVKYAVGLIHDFTPLKSWLFRKLQCYGKPYSRWFTICNAD